MSQIVNTSELRLSSVTGEGISPFVDLVASTAIMRLPHVNQAIPQAYVDLGSSLEAWSRELLAVGQPPVCTRAMVHERVTSTAALSRYLYDQEITTRALKFLASGGVVVLASNAAQSVILDPGWLADTLACVITMDPTRLSRLSPVLIQQGRLSHTPEALAAVWPEAAGYTDGLRQTLLFLLHRFDLAYELRDASGASLGCSLVPSMLPDGRSTLLSLDSAIGPLGDGHTEAGMEYRLEFVPPDLWPLLIIQFSGMVISDTCTRSSAVLHWGGQRGLVTLDVDRGLLRLVVRGPHPLELRVRFHWNLMAFVKRKYPHLATAKFLHGVCHVCHNSSPLYGRPLDSVKRGLAFECSLCFDPAVVILPSEDLVDVPSARVDGALAAGLVEVPCAARLCALAARMVDTVDALCDGQGHRAQLWLPMPALHRGGAGAAAGAASGSSDDQDHDHDHDGAALSWVCVCEDPSGWHVQLQSRVMPRTPLDTRALRAVAPVLHRVAAVVCAVSTVTGGHSPVESRDYLASQEGVRAGMADRAWASFVRELHADFESVQRRSAVHGAQSLQDGRWLCPGLHHAHGIGAPGEAGHQVRARGQMRNAHAHSICSNKCVRV
jgi:hypothetical protein